MEKERQDATIEVPRIEISVESTFDPPDTEDTDTEE